MKTLLACLALAALLGAAGCRAARNPEAEAAAVTAAKSWLALVDAEAYAESWGHAAEYFKNAVPQDEWAKTMKAGRGPLGKNLSRELASTRYLKTVPGAPDGEYVMIEFKASFENKRSAVETITPVKDKDGTWRVSGYYLR